MAKFTVNGEYAGALGLKTADYKVKPSFGEARASAHREAALPVSAVDPPA